MSVGSAYFDYPWRRKGLDHDLFSMRYLVDSKPVNWPGGKPVALWVSVDIDWFPLDMGSKPFVPPGGMVKAYPDVWNYTARDYGNRIGIYRLLDVMTAAGATATAFINGEVARRYPLLLDAVGEAGWEIAAHGLDMGHLHHSGLDRETERKLVVETPAMLTRGKNRPVGWHSPAYGESFATPELVAEAGFSYIADWVNDEMPYRIDTKAGPLVSMPIAYELSDKRILFEQNQRLDEFTSQIRAALTTLKAESTPEDGRILAISLSPWVTGQPYRIAAWRELMTELMADEAVWCATGCELAAHWRKLAEAGAATP